MTHEFFFILDNVVFALLSLPFGFFLLAAIGWCCNRASEFKSPRMPGLSTKPSSVNSQVKTTQYPSRSSEIRTEGTVIRQKQSSDTVNDDHLETKSTECSSDKFKYPRMSTERGWFGYKPETDALLLILSLAGGTLFVMSLGWILYYRLQKEIKRRELAAATYAAHPEQPGAVRIEEPKSIIPTPVTASLNSTTD